ncbi:cuticle protein 5 [Monomorium pharaonis]|uniref:cuticle protein 5 n=1 Tax=Monomorium pharaonis TaxID=307658 RepID=UPI00063F230C|nr:cuticle protein 5 [Monomorium pharaonis]
MKSLVVLSCLVLSTLALPGYAPQEVYHAYSGHHYHGPPAPLAHDGRVVDTPEVAHAKKAHLIAHAEEAAKTAHYGGGGFEGGYGGGFDGGFGGGIGGGVGGGVGGGFGGGYGGGYGGHGGHIVGYHGKLAPIGKDGRVVDTPEVAHVKAAHLHILAEEAAKAKAYAYPYPYTQGGF